jgi:hypothetical protein
VNRRAALEGNDVALEMEMGQLEGHRGPRLRVDGLENSRHAASPEQLFQLELIDPVPDE